MAMALAESVVVVPAVFRAPDFAAVGGHVSNRQVDEGQVSRGSIGFQWFLLWAYKFLPLHLRGGLFIGEDAATFT